MKLIVGVSYTNIDFEGDNYLKERVEKGFRKGLGIFDEGVRFSKAYKRGLTDGIIPFYSNKEQRFPTGLLREAGGILGKLQENYNFQFEIIDDRPDKLLHSTDLPESITLKDGSTLRDYQMESIHNVVDDRNGVLHLATNSGKTKTAVGLAIQVMPELESDERIVFFTHSKDIFDQLYETLEDNFDSDIGVFNAKKKKYEKIMVAMVPTVSSAINIDLEKDVTLTAKERIIKRVSEIVDKFEDGINQRLRLQNYIENYPVKYKTDTVFLGELTKIIEKSESDAKLKFNLNQYRAQFNKILKDRNQDKYKKKMEAIEFLESVMLGVYDECHHIKGDGYYNVVLGCSNALIKVGLTGSIDYKDPLLIQKMKSGFHNVSYEVKNKQMIDRGVSATPTVVGIPVDYVVNEGEQNNQVKYEKDYRTAYDQGIVRNEYRNALITQMTKKWYNKDHGVLIIIQRIEQGEAIQELLNQIGIPCAFAYGELDDDTRTKHINDMKTGDLKVLIASTIIDEGVDISGIDTLILAGGGKSLRQTLQRVGRGLRAKNYGDNTLNVVDFVDKTNEYLRRHSDERFKIYENEQFRVDILNN